jgi:uncharacterized DUF497 family protein
MRFVWDVAKNKTNIRDHKIDFADAKSVFDGPMLVDLDERQDYGEDRWIGIGLLHNIVVVVVYTEPSEGSIRIVSVRKANKYERERYEQALRD